MVQITYTEYFEILVTSHQDGSYDSIFFLVSTLFKNTVSNIDIDDKPSVNIYDPKVLKIF